MHDTSIHIIATLKRKWRVTTWVSWLLVAMAFSIIIACCLFKFLSLSYWWSVPAGIVLFVAFLLLDKTWKINEGDVARYLNTRYPELEESADLLLQSPGTLTRLQVLQAAKSSHILSTIENPGRFKGKLGIACLVFIIASVVCILIYFLPVTIHPGIANLKSENTVVVKERLPILVTSVTISIHPPSYTGKPVRQQQQFGIEAEEGALINWQVRTSIPVNEVAFIFNDTRRELLHALNKENTLWGMDIKISNPGFYQLKTDSIVSDLYKLDMIKDHPPTINIHHPKENTVIDFGEPRNVNMDMTVADDYGIKDVSIAATVSTGSGEAVKFEQKQIRFNNSFSAQLPQYQLMKGVDLTSLGMKPGDELYFYVKAIDNNNQEKRSDIYIVSITDTAQLLSMVGLMKGLNLKPEYFRSERQIIIETEQLIKDKSKLTEEEFKTRGNNLGIDQKLLRLRYGKFLGEEGETNVDENGGTTDPADFGDAGKILEAYTDKHDNSEDASFFSTETKKQLKATLTEMWNAELQLRTFKPADALPFEYKALRLLKDLQQKSRAYVAKTNIATAPLKPEKRLTADLSKITEPLRQSNIKQSEDQALVTRQALAVLAQLKAGYEIHYESLNILKQASLKVADKAIISPSNYLSSLDALKRVIDSVQKKKLAGLSDIEIAGKALQRMAESPSLLPFPEKKQPGIKLSAAYFSNLKKINQP